MAQHTPSAVGTSAPLALIVLLSSSNCMSFLTPASVGFGRLLSPTRAAFASSRRSAVRALSSSSSSSSASSTSSTSPSAPSGQAEEECPLPFETLPYRGAEVRVPIVKGEATSTANDDFLSKLRSALDYWSRNDFTSAWLRVPSSRASLVESLTAAIPTSTLTCTTSTHDTDLNFDLHHVNATESTIVLKKWLRPGSEDKVPPFATHQVGCAGFCLSDDNELLLVREWSGSPSNRTPTKQWKLPGGLLDAGETFEEAACREVEEETGVRCTFESVLAFWHRHGLTFGKSDFYFVCMLRPQTKEFRIDPMEISDATWMPVEEFLKTHDHPLIHHILRNVFKLGVEDKDQNGSLGGTNERLKPAVEMIEGDVRFGSRDPFLTYTGRAFSDKPI